MMNIEIYKKIKAQEEYCKEKKLPFFSPEDGVCYHCQKQIFERYSLSFCKNNLITGYPYCCHSYCE